MQIPPTRIVFLYLLVCFLSSVSALAATFTVNSKFDNESNGCSVGACTLREAITAANGNGEDDAIFFDQAVFGFANQIDLNGTALPSVAAGTKLSINGPGRNLLTISASNASSLIENGSNARLTIYNLTIRATNDATNGAVRNSGFLTLENVDFRDNQGANGTSALVNFASASINNCTFQNNFNYARVIYNRVNMSITNSTFTGNASGSGTSILQNNAGIMTVTRTSIRNNNSRAVYNDSLATVTADLTVTESDFSGNISSNTSNGGGAILNTGTVTISSSALASNIANRGGAIASEQGSVTLTNATIYGNQATETNANYSDALGGGGLWLQNTSATIINSTIYKNDSMVDTGGLKKIGTTTINVANTIIAGNTARTVSYFGIPINNPDAYGSFTTRGGNIIGVTSPNGVTLNGGWSTNVGDKIDVNVASIGLSTTIGNNGGFAPTVALNCCGLAVGGGRTQGQSGFPTPTADARRVPRVNNSGFDRNDAGAFQYAEMLPVTSVPDLTNLSDTGISSADNITNSRAPVFKISGAIPNAKVYLLKNSTGFMDAFADANGEVLFTDNAPLANGTVNYSTKQEIPGAGSPEGTALTVTYDTTAPTATINQANGQLDPATAQPVNFNAAFSETVYNFDASDVSLAGSTADLSAVDVSLSGSGANYIVSVENILTIGKIVADIPADTATDAAGNGNTAAGSSDRTVAFIGNGQVFVNKTANSNSCIAANCSLRGAVGLIQSLALPSTNININFNVEANDAGCENGVCRINLGGSELEIKNSTVTIDGAGANKIVVSGNNLSRVIYNQPNASLTLKNLTVSDGNATSSLRPAENGDGGGITNLGTMRLENVTVSNNSANLYNGAIRNLGALSIFNSTVNGNNAAYNSSFGTTGGIGSSGTLIVVNSTVSGNRAHNNASNSGGGIWSSGSLTVVNSTITDNQANTSPNNQSAGGIRNTAAAAQTNIRNSIVAANRQNSTVPDVLGTFNSLGNNFIGNNPAGSGFGAADDKTGSGANPLDPKIAPLGNYGGATQTHALLNNSPAKDAGNDCVFSGGCGYGFGLLTNDQRVISAPRKIGVSVDIGAFESNVSFSTSQTGAGGQGTLPNAQVNQNYSVTFSASRLTNLLEFESGRAAGNFAPFTFSVIAGSLPPGLSLDLNSGVLSGAPTQTGLYNFTVQATDSDGIAGIQSYSLQVNAAPTAASVSIGGRVLDSNGRGVFSAQIVLIDAQGIAHYTRSNPFGFYRVGEISVGQIVTVNVGHKHFTFAPQVVNVNEEIENLNFVSQPMN